MAPIFLERDRGQPGAPRSGCDTGARGAGGGAVRRLPRRAPLWTMVAWGAAEPRSPADCGNGRPGGRSCGGAMDRSSPSMPQTRYRLELPTTAFPFQRELSLHRLIAAWEEAAAEPGIAGDVARTVVRALDGAPELRAPIE